MLTSPKIPLKSEIFSDEKLQLITGQIFVGQAILVAYKLGLFKIILEKIFSLKEIAINLSINERAAQAIVTCACSLDLIEFVENGYRLSALGKVYFDEKNPEYYGKVLDLLIQENHIMNFETIKKCLTSNQQQICEKGELFSASESLSSTAEFIASLHHKAYNPAFFWSKTNLLASCKKMVDLGGGSGIHTIAACLNHSHLLGLVCDRPGVLPHTSRYIEEFGLTDRIIPIPLNIWEDPFPLGDLYFLSDIFHDWSREKCIFLAKKCFQHLPNKGHIVIHEMLFNSDKTGPLLTAAYNMKMMVWTEGQQFSFPEICDILQEAGFKDIREDKALGNWSIVVGQKQ
ncbi:MAG: methyltransferase [Chlamydiales bacterium]|nr:methyltransferase [Chlamydiales bacterium]